MPAFKDQAALTWQEKLQGKYPDSKNEIAEIKGRLEGLENDRRPLLLDHIPIQTIKSNASYFCVPNIVSYSLGNSMTHKIPTSFLPSTNILAADIITICDSRTPELSSLVEVCTITLEAIQIDASRKILLKSQLESLAAEKSDEEAHLKAQIKNTCHWGPQSNILDLEQRDRPEAARYLQELLCTFESRVKHSQACMTSLLQGELEHLRMNIDMLERNIKDVDMLIQENSAMKSKWEGLLEDYNASLQGTRMTGKILSTVGEEMHIGVFTILRLGIEEFDEKSREPWVRLGNSLKDLYECDEERFEKVCTSLIAT